MRTPIIGRPRPLSRDRRAHPSYTVNCDEPDYSDPHYETNVCAADTGWWDGPQQRQDTGRHTYGCKWNSTGVYFYRDGSLIGYTENASYVPAGPLYVTLNSGARTPASPTFKSATVEVGYYRAWVTR